MYAEKKLSISSPLSSRLQEFSLIYVGMLSYPKSKRVVAQLGSTHLTAQGVKGSLVQIQSTDQNFSPGYSWHDEQNMARNPMHKQKSGPAAVRQPTAYVRALRRRWYPQISSRRAWRRKPGPELIVKFSLRGRPSLMTRMQSFWMVESLRQQPVKFCHS